MLVLTYDKVNGMPTADGKAAAFIKEAIERHAKGIKEDPKYSMSITTASFCVVLALIKAVANDEMHRKYLALQYKSNGVIAKMDVENIEQEDIEDEPMDDIVVAFSSGGSTVELEVGCDVDLDDLADVIL